RAVVRLLTPDGQALAAVGLAAAHAAWLRPFRGEPVPLEEDPVARRAVHSGRSQVVLDTRPPGTDFRRVKPVAACHAAVVLRPGGHVLGVLSMDWDRPNAGGAAVLGPLEELAARYALALKAVSNDHFFALLDRRLAEGGEVSYWCFVRLVARMVG